MFNPLAKLTYIVDITNLPKNVVDISEFGTYYELGQNTYQHYNPKERLEELLDVEENDPNDWEVRMAQWFIDNNFPDEFVVHFWW
jgi:hypothetical protein